MNIPANAAPDAPPLTANRTLSILMLGVGGAGGNAVAHLASEAVPGMRFAVTDTDASALAQWQTVQKLTLALRLSRGLGAGGDPERGRQAAEDDSAQIRALCDGVDLVFVVVGLGGGIGTGAGPVVARVAKEAGALVLGIALLPFDCEGTRRSRQALFGLTALKSAADGVICVPNQSVFKLVDEHTSLLEAFHLTNELVAQGLRSIWRLLFRPGLIHVDFGHLCAVTQGRHAESCLATAEAQGENRAREVTEKILAHPLTEGGALLAEAAGVLVSIAGGVSLSLGEVNRIMEQINRHCEHAQITLGASIDETLGDRLVVTVVASRNGTPTPTTESSRSASSEFAGLTEERPLSAGQSRPPSRFVASAPTLTTEQREELFFQQSAPSARSRKGSARLKQGQLPLEIVSKGRFEKSEPTIHHGQDLDVPTYIRRGVALN
jgi:cell division protein FtsZ